MMSTETFLALLLVVSIFTGLVTEGIKMALDEANRTYKPNMLAGAVAVVLSVLVDVGYMMETQFTEKMMVVLIALVLLSWLCAMLGYDKVIQSIMQIKNQTK